MIKWKSLFISVLVIGALAVINVFFIDQWVKYLIEKSLEAAAGAKVEIDSADVHFRPLGANLKHIQIADKNYPFQNLIELDEVRLNVKSGPLLEKKVIIQDIAITGAAFSTPRKTSGALPKKKDEPPSKLARKTSELINEQMAKLGLNNLTKPMPTFKVDTEHLLVNQKLAEANEKVKSTQKKWETGFTTLQLDTRIRGVQDQATKLTQTRIDKLNSIEDLTKIKTTLDSVNQLVADAQGIQRDVDARVQMVKADYVDLSKLPGGIQDAAKQDYENILNQLHINDLKSGNFANLFFEENATQRIDELVSQIQDLIDKAGAFKTPKPAIKNRYEGVDIHFGKPKSLPAFWIQLIHLSGASKTGQSWDGKITDITSDQSKTTVPTIVDIRGQNVLKSACSMRIYGRVDLRQTPMRNQFNVSLLNYRFDPYFLFKLKEQPVTMTNGVGQLKIALNHSGRYFSGRINTQLNQIQTDVARIATDSFSGDRVLASFVEKVDRLEIEGTVNGTPGNIQLGLSSNVDELFRRNFEQIWEEQLAEARAKVQAEIDKVKAQAEKAVMDAIAAEKKKVDDQLAIYNQKAKELQSQLDAQKKQLEQKLESQKQVLEAKKKELQDTAQKEIDAKKQEAEAKKKELEDAAKKEVEARKKQAEDAAKKEAENQLKKALPKFF